MEPTPGPDPELASLLRQGAGREWAEEAAENERLTELQRDRRRDLSNLFADLYQKGQRVSVDFGGHSFSGAIVSGGEDYATIEGSGQTVDVKLAVGAWSLLAPGQPVQTRPGTAESFRALLHQYADQRARVRLALEGGQVAIGVISVVATDHVEMRDVDDRPAYLPEALILGVIRSSEFQ